MKINWKQAIVEAVLICLGVVLALAGQSWWEERSERSLEQRYFISLGEEFAANEVLLQDLIETRKQLLASAVEILESLEKGSSPSRAEELRGITGLGHHRLFAPSKAALDDLINSGSLRVIRNSELRLALAGYLESIEQNEWREENTLRFFWQVFVPMSLSKDFVALEAPPRHREPDDFPHSRFEVDYSRLTESLEFENLVAMFIYMQRDAIVGNEALLSRLREVRALLSEELL